jgi:DNA polymerase-3 subunit delta
VKLTLESLATHLGREIKSAYLISGDEPLLSGEAADAIRRRARENGYVERQVFFVERGFDWNALRGASQSLSLFAERRILEVRLPTAKPGDGAAILESIVTDPPPDQLLLVVSGKLERAALQSGWVQAFERLGVWVPVWPIDIERLPEWIARRLRARGLEPDADAARLLAERVEGNLLAAQQEIEKLALLVKPGPLDAATLAQAVANSARYDVFQLSAAALQGDAERALRILAGLRAEGVEATLALWALNRDIRALWQRLAPHTSGRSPPAWQRPSQALEAAARRIRNPAAIRTLVAEALLVDRTIKGRRRGNPWDALERLVARLAGAKNFPHAA